MATTASLVLFAVLFHGRLLLATCLPWSNVIVLGNWIPLGAALLAGICVEEVNIGRRRRRLWFGLLTAMAWYVTLEPLVAAWAARTEFHDSRHSLVQESQVSCSAACAARLLTLHGIATNEAEMTRLCLTSRLGTPPLGLYRGLLLKTHGTEWAVSVTCCRFQSLRQDRAGPMLLPVRLSGPQVVRSFDDQLIGWSPGMTHMILLYGFTESGRPVIWDPAIPDDPNYLWTDARLKELWCGEAIHLTRWK